jgi:hypothetical protein
MNIKSPLLVFLEAFSCMMAKAENAAKDSKLIITILTGKKDEMAIPGFCAPEKRGGYYFHHAVPTYLTDEGWILFDKAIPWLLEI